MRVIGGPMALLARLLLRLAWLGGWLLLLLGVFIGWSVAPEAGVILMVCVFVGMWKAGALPRLRHGNVLGDARWAELSDVLNAGAVGAGGLPVGSLPPPTRKEAFAALRKLPWRMNRQACRLVWSWLRKRRVPVTLADVVNTCILSPTGAGKTSAFIIPALLQLNWSAVCIDPAGEIALATSKHRKLRGHKVVILNPFAVAGLPNDHRLNPLLELVYDDPYVTDKARAISESLVPRPPAQVESHWADTAVVIIQVVILYVVAACHTLGSRKEQTLATVFAIIADPAKLSAAMEVLQHCPDHAGVLSDLGFQVAGLQDRERSSVISTALRSLSFVQTAAVKAATQDSTFRLSDLRAGRLTVYLVIPPQYLKSHAGLVRVWLNACVNAVVEAGANRHARVLFALDEYAALGRMEVIEQALTQHRKFGTRLMLAVQSSKMLETAFPEGGADLVLGNCTQIYMGLRDHPTAKLLSESIGVHTVTKYGMSGGTSDSYSYGPDGAKTGNYGSSSNWNADAVAVELLKPEQALQLGDRVAVVMTPGLAPLLVQTHRFFEAGYRQVFARETGAFGLLIRSVLALAAVGGALFGLATVGMPAAIKAGEEWRAKHLPPPVEPQTPAAVPPDPELHDPGIVRDAFNQIARDGQGRPIRIPPGMHVEWDLRPGPGYGKAWLVRNGDRMFR